MATLLKETSPRINAQWLATATALCETGRRTLSVPCCQLWLWMLPGMCVLNGLFWLWSLGMLVQDEGQPFGAVAGGGISLAHAFFTAACAGDALFMLSSGLALPLIHLPQGSPLKGLPDVALLLLVLHKLRITRPVSIVNAADPQCIGCSRLSRVLATVRAHGAIRTLPCLPPIEEEAAGKSVLVVLDLDAVGLGQPPPSSLRVEEQSDGLRHCVCWSADRGFAGVCGTEWEALVRHTIVGQPRRSDFMVEAVLCRILELALHQRPQQADSNLIVQTDDSWRLNWEPPSMAGTPTMMVAGGRWEVDPSLLAPEEDHGAALRAKKKWSMANGEKSARWCSRRRLPVKQPSSPPDQDPQPSVQDSQHLEGPGATASVGQVANWCCVQDGI